MSKEIVAQCHCENYDMIRWRELDEQGERVHVVEMVQDGKHEEIARTHDLGEACAYYQSLIH